MSGFIDCAIDPGIVARARRGDMEAHEVLFRTYSAPVYTLARRLVPGSATAEEILQETFVEVIRRIGSFRGAAPLGAWIRRIAVNKCLMYLRSAWYRKSRPLEPESAGAAQMAPAVDAHHGYGSAIQARIDLEAALASLSAAARAVVWLHDVEGYTHKEIGKLMGKSTSFSKSQLARAHRQLQGLLADCGEAADPCEAEPCMQLQNSF